MRTCELAGTTCHRVKPTVARCRNRDIKDSSHVCSDVTWTYTIDLDVVLAPFIAQRFGQLPKCSFCRGVRRDCEATLKGHERAKVDYLSSAQRDHVAAGCL